MLNAPYSYIACAAAQQLKKRENKFFIWSLDLIVADHLELEKFLYPFN
jgi:hypothetical protein